MKKGGEKERRVREQKVMIGVVIVIVIVIVARPMMPKEYDQRESRGGRGGDV